MIAFGSKDDNLTKGHIKYLEHKLIAIARNNNNYKIHNKNEATKSPLLDIQLMGVLVGKMGKEKR